MNKVNPYAAFNTNQKEEVEGVYVNYGPFRVKVARAGGANRPYVQAQDRKARALRRLGTPSLQSLEAMQLELIVEHCIKSWEIFDGKKWVPGIQDPITLEVIPFTPENVQLTFKKVPDLAKSIQSEANSLDLFLEQEVKEEAGN